MQRGGLAGTASELIKMIAALDLLTAVFALLAAIFWFRSAAKRLSPQVTNWGGALSSASAYNA